MWLEWLFKGLQQITCLILAGGGTAYFASEALRIDILENEDEAKRSLFVSPRDSWEDWCHSHVCTLIRSQPPVSLAQQATNGKQLSTANRVHLPNPLINTMCLAFEISFGKNQSVKMTNCYHSGVQKLPVETPESQSPPLRKWWSTLTYRKISAPFYMFLSHRRVKQDMFTDWIR